MLKHILIPLDGSQLAEKALDYARRVISPKTEITLLMAIDPPDYLAYGQYSGQSGGLPATAAGPIVDYQAMAQDMMSHARTYLNRVADELRKSGYTVHVTIETGTPADVVIETARKHPQIDTIVMSTHGRSGLTRWLLGSVTIKVLNAAPCPVYVIPPEHGKD
jgi:nucleotide-binding universal stress UspA family protein